MGIEVGCRCGKRFLAPEQLAGKTVACPECRQSLAIPARRAEPAVRTEAVATGLAATAPVVVSCGCGSRFQARGDLVGQQRPCPSCGRKLTIGQQSPAAAEVGSGGSIFDELPPVGLPVGPTAPPPLRSPATAAIEMASPPARLPIYRATLFGLQPVLSKPRSGPRKGYELAPGRGVSELVARLICAFIGLGFGIVFAWFAYNDYQISTASQSWPSVEGTITSAEIVSDGFRRFRERFKAVVAYSYAVDGAPYSSNRLAFQGYGSLLDEEAVVEKYSVGSKHPVYYDPANPASAVLEKGFTMTSIFLPLFAVTFIVAAVIMIGVYTMTIVHRVT